MGTSSSLGQVQKGGQVQSRDKYINGDKNSLGQHCSQVLGVVSGIQDGPVLTDPDDDFWTPESLL